jgi:hypothetical protein
MEAAYLGLKALGVEADHPPICISELKKWWSYTTKLTCPYFVQSPVLKYLIEVNEVHKLNQQMHKIV